MSIALKAYVLAKNEKRNIGRGLASLSSLGIQTVVLDSGSTDGTQEVAAGYPGVEVRSFEYRNHCDSYNTIIQWHTRDQAILILDADMQVTKELVAELTGAFEQREDLDAVIAPVLMYWEGKPLRYSSLYPPKPIAFRGGRPLFESHGHGERLMADVRAVQTSSRLIHDDRKAMEQVLANQWRYAKETVRRGREGHVGLKDRLKLTTPLMMFIIPLYALIVRRGFMDRRVGLIYAMDRLIAEALTYRASLSYAVEEELQAQRTSTDTI